MYLTDEEKSMLDGEQGLVRQCCMQFLVESAEVSGADRLVDLNGTGDFHTPMTAMTDHYDFSIDDLRALVESGAKFKIPTFANKTPFPNPSPMHGWEGCGMHPHCEAAYHEKALHKDYMDLFKKMGLMDSHTCAPYLTATYWPIIGQHCSWHESSSVPYCNSMLGGRTNIDGSFATCFLGKAANYGMHVTENRYAKTLIRTERTISSEMEWDLYGFAIGERTGMSVPCLTGTAMPTTTKIQKLCSSLNTGGSVTMFHIPGVTPEAPSVEYAFNFQKPKNEIMIGERELRETYEKLNYHTSDDVDMVSLGCPHYNIVELMRLAHKLEGKKVKVRTWIMTVPWLYNVAKELGYLKIFEDAGANLMTGTCPAAMGGVAQGTKVLAVDSAKQSYYITGCYPDDDNRLQVCYGTQEDCINAALTGKWHGEWR